MVSEEAKNLAKNHGNSAIVWPFRTSTDAPADLQDDLHIRFQGSRLILAPPCDAAFRPDRGIERPQHDILVLEFFDLLWH